MTHKLGSPEWYATQDERAHQLEIIAACLRQEGLACKLATQTVSSNGEFDIDVGAWPALYEYPTHIEFIHCNRRPHDGKAVAGFCDVIDLHIGVTGDTRIVQFDLNDPTVFKKIADYLLRR